jgi:CBS domain-containing protein
MLRLRDIMSTDLITVDPNLTIREAMEEFASKHISGAPVVAGDEVVGVISATDLIQFASAMPGVPTERERPEDLLDDRDDSDAEAATPSSEDDPSGIFFTEMWGDSGAPAAERMAAPATAEWNSLEQHTVSDAMTRTPVHAMPPETLVTDAAEYMGNAGIHRVLVMVGPRLVGLVTTTDITRAVAEGKLTAHTYVFPRRIPRVVHSPLRPHS